MTDHNEAKLRSFARAARRFIAAADALVNAEMRLQQCEPGRPSYRNAAERQEKASTAYDTAKAALNSWIEDMGPRRRTE